MAINSFNTAEQAAERAIEQIYKCIKERDSFKVEAGAGAGKTHSLILSLKYIINSEGTNLLRKSQRIACITFTNVAKNEIDSRIDRHPLVHSDTIHGFCWSVIKDFQHYLRKELLRIDYWSKEIKEDEINSRQIVYTLGYRTFNEENIYLAHNDILSLLAFLLEKDKFRDIFVSKYPILFIDEYQDTDKNFVEALEKYFFGTKEKLLIGFFGDFWQKIYSDGCGKIEHCALKVISLNSNFRSTKVIVTLLNEMRHDLKQEYKGLHDEEGLIKVYHTNLWSGERCNDSHMKGCIPFEEAKDYQNNLVNGLKEDGWDNIKILMLTHKVLAEIQGYKDIERLFKNNKDKFSEKNDPYISFFDNIIEPICLAYENKKIGEVFKILGNNCSISSPNDKSKWSQQLKELINLRQEGTIGKVIDYSREINIGLEINQFNNEPDYLSELRKIAYSQMINFSSFLNERTSFSTKHGVKGEEFENVLVCIGGGWNKYNFNQMLEWLHLGIPKNKEEEFERCRNLFYVSCSRAKKRLALLFTQKLSENALTTLEKWFGSNSIHALSDSSSF